MTHFLYFPTEMFLTENTKKFNSEECEETRNRDSLKTKLGCMHHMSLKHKIYF